MKPYIYFFLFIVSVVNVRAQYITHGPVIGGVKSDAVNIYLRTSVARAFKIEYDTDPLFGSTMQISDSTRVWRDSSMIITLSGLSPRTKYFFRFTFDDSLIDSRKGSFTTAPLQGTAGNYVFVAGSCQETPNMKVFDILPKHAPDLFLHLGDFTYPSYQLDSSYPNDFKSVEKAYRIRYQEVNMDTMLFNMPIDYINDDDDGFGPCHDGWYQWDSDTIGGTFHNKVTLDTVTSAMRSNCTNGYIRFFPGYTPVDTSSAGLYHKFTYGNTEVFFLDTRNVANSITNAYSYDSISNNWTFSPPAGHSIVGSAQMSWLKDALQNSTATWKIIAGGVPFNPGYRRLIDLGMVLQNYVTTIAGAYGSGMRLSVSFSGYWAGYPDDFRALLNHIKQNNIKNTIFVSGDTHHNVMDDGTNSKIPELNASGLSVSSTELAYQLDQASAALAQPSVSDSLWNKGGNGLGNLNFLNGFGKVEILGNDSVRLCVIDENNITLKCFVIHAGYVASWGGLQDPNSTSIEGFKKVFPNPAKDEINVELSKEIDVTKINQIYICNIEGEMIRKLEPSIFNQESKSNIHLKNMSDGMYFLFIDTDETRFGSSFIIQHQ